MKENYQTNRFFFLNTIFLFFALISIGITGELAGQEANHDLLTKLKALPGAEIESIQPDSHFTAGYKILLMQPLDHSNPNGKQFQQRILLSHLDFSRPVIIITEGYAIGRNYIQELSTILNANQIRVEHRYFGQSLPDSMDWRYLNIKQAAADYHRIVDLFKSIYPGKWISTGWSKGGQTSLFFRRFYPNDVDATVAYDAPLNFSQEEPRIDHFFETVGTEYCRQRLIEFQRQVLQHKKEILPRFHWYARGKGYKYSIGEEKALEYIVLEYPFSFWQYEKIDCRDIPQADASEDEMLEHLIRVVSFSSYSDRALNSTSMYQFATELGYYGYVTKNVEDLLSSDNYPNTAYAPQNTDLTFHPEVMQDINDWLQANGNNILYIYGEVDPWSAPQVEVSQETNALKMILGDGNHFTFINSFPDEQKERIINTLNKWLEIK